MTEEQKQCKDTLEEGKVWICHWGKPETVRSFVEVVYKGIDFDTNFEMRPFATVFGPAVGVRKRREIQS